MLERAGKQREGKRLTNRRRGAHVHEAGVLLSDKVKELELCTRRHPRSARGMRRVD